MVRFDWTIEELQAIYRQPILELIFNGAKVHREYHDASKVQRCALLSIKTGGCSEDCKYCPQSSRYQTQVKPEPMLGKEQVLDFAIKAKERGATRVCLGAAWRQVRDGNAFDRILEMIRSVTDMGLEVCTTLGMLTEDQAQRLADAGLYAYNHNLDASRKFYKTIITTRSYDERLETIGNVRKAKITVCCGGIIGMGESEEDRLELLRTLATMDPHPESVPINQLVKVKGTPMADLPALSIWETVRMIATARIAMPKTMVRLSAGRNEMSIEQQALCFLAGANSIFIGDKLLTTPNPSRSSDEDMLQILGLNQEKNESLIMADSR